jgi:hypothetical protein
LRNADAAALRRRGSFRFLVTHRALAAVAEPAFRLEPSRTQAFGPDGRAAVDPSYPRDPPVSRLASFAGIMQTALMLSKSELARILIDHSWSNLEDWARALRDLATLSDRDVEQLERQAPPRPAPCSGD